MKENGKILWSDSKEVIVGKELPTPKCIKSFKLVTFVTHKPIRYIYILDLAKQLILHDMILLLTKDVFQKRQFRAEKLCSSGTKF